MVGCQLLPPSYVSFYSIYVWLVQNCTLPGEGVSTLLRAKGFTWTPSVRQILVLVLRLDCEFVMTFQRHGALGTSGFFSRPAAHLFERKKKKKKKT